MTKKPEKINKGKSGKVKRGNVITMKRKYRGKMKRGKVKHKNRQIFLNIIVFRFIKCELNFSVLLQKLVST